ncbi:MAG: sigma-70 family RNA polymerase sigma factor [Pseudomonadota bacterium]
MIPEQSPRTVTDEDAEVIRAINDGRPDRFQEIVQRYEGRLYNFGLKMCGHVQDAEDLVQETFLNAFRYMGGFRFETKFRNWLYRVATSVCLKKRRRSKFAPEKELSLEEFLPAEGESPPDAVPEWAAQPLDQLLTSELSKVIRDAIVDLPESYRLVVVLRDLEGFSTEETAQMLSLTPTNVKVRLHRGRLFLREKLKGYFLDAP